MKYVDNDTLPILGMALFITVMLWFLLGMNSGDCIETMYSSTC